MRKLFAFKGFTLAEVLITLGIIGVIAAMTLPTVIANYQKASYVTGLKKFSSSGNQVLNLIASDYGCPGDLACTGIFNSDDDALGAIITKYFKVTKNCGTSTTDKCWAIVNSNYDGTGGTHDYNKDSTYKFITADGMSVMMHSYGSNCADWDFGYTHYGPVSHACGYLSVDVNGFKTPNRLGRDVFAFYIVSGKGGTMLYPNGGPDDGYYGYWADTEGKDGCDADLPHTNGHTHVSGPTFGEQCTGRIIGQSWQMNY